LILAITTQHEVHLVESDQRKCAFLRAAAREVGVDVVIHNERIEALPDIEADVITARALAPLDKLLDLTHHHHHDNQQLLFLKGKTAKQELTILASWPRLSAVLHPSITDSEATLIHLSSNA
ncbi:class I SAM-dependent methyltransferase, partial [Alphaproteobacteria bacterium]|nr:class I SAM-dependent methyltransferase [Alphaproteobacteria bacterium]